MSQSALIGVSAVPAITAIIQIAKSSGLPKNLAPALALSLGLVAGLLSVWQSTPQYHPIPWAAGVILGLSWGLAAAGLYATGKHLAQTTKLKPTEPPPKKAQP